MISYLLVVEQHRTQIVIHALLKCQQENLYHEQNVTQDRKSGSAGMPRPISYAVFCLKKKRVLNPTYQAGLRRDAVQPYIEAERKKRDEIEAGKSYCSRRFGGATCDDKSEIGRASCRERV